MPKVTLINKQVSLERKITKLRKLTLQPQVQKEEQLQTTPQQGFLFTLKSQEIDPQQTFLSITDKIDDELVTVEETLKSDVVKPRDKQKASNALAKIYEKLTQAKQALKLIPDNYHETTMYNAYVKEYYKSKLQFIWFSHF